MPSPDNFYGLRARRAAAVRHGNAEAAAAAALALTEAKLERAIREAVAAAPPLSDTTRDRLAALLRAGGR